MNTPDNKSSEVKHSLNQISQTLFGNRRSTSRAIDVCVACKGPATEFKDELSRREFGISALCQKCQDEIFG